MTKQRFGTAALIAVTLMLYSASAAAQLTNEGMLDQVVTAFATRAASWQGAITAAATWLFWVLVMISMVWTGGMMALRGAGIQEFFSEFVRFIMFTGFYWWLLISGPAVAPDAWGAGIWCVFRDAIRHRGYWLHDLAAGHQQPDSLEPC
jgi:type IV secretory pathway TrbL component